MDVAVKTKKLSFTYKTLPPKGIKDSISRLIKRQPICDEHSILKDVSFTLEKGSALALIGNKGAGKTFLLRLIAGIMTPTSGKIITQGFISPVFRDNTGFDPSLSVMDNVYFLGAMRGYSRKYMESLIKKIIEFAGLEEQLNVPAEECTDDMLSRLAFSIAAFIKTDLLIIDEALSSCNEEFCERCTEKMLEMKSKGVSILFVSDSMKQAMRLCEKALWIDDGKVKMFGEFDDVIKAYNDFYKIQTDN